MTYGVTPTGFVRPSLQELLDERNADQRAGISQSLDQSAESPLGQINGSGCRQLAIAWEALETCHNGFDPDRAEDFLLTALGKLTGTFRTAATKSTVDCTVTLAAGTTLLAGVHFARQVGNPNVRFTPRENLTATSTGAIANVLFEAETAGPVEVGAGQLSVIATAVVGWSAVTNPNPAIAGKVAEGDVAFRPRREAEVVRAGNQTAAAIKADLYALRYNDLQWVQSVEVFENVDNITDVDGRPPHSFEVLIYDIGEPADSDDQIAQVIWNNKPQGIDPWGAASDAGNAVNEKGETVVVPYTQATTVPIYVSMTLTTVAGFAGAAAVKDLIVSKCRAAYGKMGTDVIALQVRSLALGVSGVVDVPTFTIGTAPSPVGTSNIAIAARNVATFSTSRIVIT